MSKKILVLNGSARKNGSTIKLVQAFSEGAIRAGHHVQEFYLDSMNIHSCKGCLRAGKDSKSPCSQKDDMDKIYSAFSECDVLVSATVFSVPVIVQK